VFLGQLVRPFLGIVLDDLAHDHRAQPLAHVTLVEAGCVGYLVAGGGGQPRHGVEKTRPVTYARHERDRPLVEDAYHPLGELLGLCPVKIRCGHRYPFLRLLRK
jgi:hypothetical protein